MNTIAPIDTKHLATLASETLRECRGLPGVHLLDDRSLPKEQLQELKDIAEGMGLRDLDAVNVLLAMASDVQNELLPEWVDLHVLPHYDEMIDGYSGEGSCMDGAAYRRLLKECFRQRVSFDEITCQALERFAEQLGSDDDAPKTSNPI